MLTFYDTYAIILNIVKKENINMSKEQPIVTVNDLLQNGPVDERKNDGRGVLKR